MLPERMGRGHKSASIVIFHVYASLNEWVNLSTMYNFNKVLAKKILGTNMIVNNSNMKISCNATFIKESHTW